VLIKDLLDNFYFLRVVLVLWLASSAFVLFLLSRIDWIVHHDLYGFGLQFSIAWANPYWVSLRLIYVCLAVPSVFSAFVLGLDFWRWFRSDRHVSKRKRRSEVQPSKNNQMLVSCPRCKKVFAKPLVMLDFSGGKPRLVNICPHCNAVLASAEADGESLETVPAVDLNKKVSG